MFGSFIFNIKASMAKAKEKAELRRKARAQKRLAEGKGTVLDQKIANKKVKRSRAWLTRIKAGIVGAVEAIPVVSLVAKIVILLVALILVVALILAFVQALVSSVVDMTTMGGDAMTFMNNYDSMKLSEELSDDGSYHTVIQKIYATDDPDVPPGEFDVTTDVALWCSLSDAQIEEYIGDQFDTLNARVYAMNVVKTIRMAYRICYAGDEKGEDGSKRYLKGIEPEFLVGIIMTEKGYGWMQAESAYAVKSAGYAYDIDPTDNAWYRYEDGIRISKEVSETSPDYTYMSVDNCAPEIFYDDEIVSGSAYPFMDGPYSFSSYSNTSAGLGGDSSFTEHLVSAINSYKDLYDSLTSQYSSYAWMLDVVKYDHGNYISYDDNSLIGYLLPSMLLTAINYDVDYYDGDPYGDSCFLARYINPKSAGESATYDLLYEKNSGIANFYSNSVLENLLISVDPSYNTPDDISDGIYQAYVRQLANSIYYSFHHMRYFASNQYVPYFGEDNGYTEDDWYVAQLWVCFTAVYKAEGNIGNYDAKAVTDSYEDDWRPWGTVDLMCQYKGGIGGQYFNYYTSSTTNTNFIELVQDSEWTGYVDNDGVEAISEYEPFYVGDTQLVCSVLKLILSPKFGKTDISIACVPALKFPSKLGFGNCHAQLVEGMISVISGGDVIKQCLNALLASLPSQDPVTPSTPGTTGGIDNFITEHYSDVATWNMNSTFITPDGDKQQGILPILDFDPSASGMQAIPNDTSAYAYLAQGTGFYTGSTDEHSGIDFSYLNSSVGTAWNTIEDYNFSHMYTSRDIKGSISKYLTSLDGTTADAFWGRPPIVSIADGVLIEVGCNVMISTISGDNTYMRPRGNYVVIRYTVMLDGENAEMDIIYMHMSSDMIEIWDEISGGECSYALNNGTATSRAGTVQQVWTPDVGDYVIKQGQLLGFVGNTGQSEGCHLHFNVPGSKNKYDSTGITCARLFGFTNASKWAYKSAVDGVTYYPFHCNWLKLFKSANGIDGFLTMDYYEAMMTAGKSSYS